MRSTRLLLLAALAIGARAQAYDLFHPLPADQMPELSTDRPDKTEAWASVPAGHWQLESDLLIVAREQADGVRAEDWSTLDFNLKAGLEKGLDLQVVHEPLLRGSAEDLSSGDSVDTAGHGDLLLRLKLNLRQPEGVQPGVALMPYFKLPAASEGLGNGLAEYGLIIPVGWSLPDGWDLGTMLELDMNADALKVGRHLDTVLSVTTGHELFGPLGFYTELWAQLSGESGVNGQATYDLGLTCGLGDNAQADAGVNLGLNDSATDWESFVGLSLRL